MTIRNDLAGFWIVFLTCAVVVCGAREKDHEQRVTRTEFRLLYHKLQGNKNWVQRSDMLRRESAARAEDWQHVTIALAISSIFAAVSIMNLGVTMSWLLLSASFGFTFVGPFVVPTIMAKLPGLIAWAASVLA